MVAESTLWPTLIRKRWPRGVWAFHRRIQVSGTSWSLQPCILPRNVGLRAERFRRSSPPWPLPLPHPLSQASDILPQLPFHRAWFQPRPTLPCLRVGSSEPQGHMVCPTLPPPPPPRHPPPPPRHPNIPDHFMIPLDTFPYLLLPDPREEGEEGEGSMILDPDSLIILTFKQPPGTLPTPVPTPRLPPPPLAQSTLIPTSSLDLVVTPIPLRPMVLIIITPRVSSPTRTLPSSSLTLPFQAHRPTLPL